MNYISTFIVLFLVTISAAGGPLLWFIAALFATFVLVGAQDRAYVRGMNDVWC